MTARRLDLVGQRFGSLIVTGFAGINGAHTKRACTMWECRCDCGNTRIAEGHHLTSGMTTSCRGYNGNYHPIPERRLNLKKGQRFGKLTVIKSAGTDGRGSLWDCKCDCGNKRVINGAALNKGAVRSCGCGYRPNLIRGFTRRESQKLGAYTSGAKNKGIVWALSDDGAVALFHQPCFYCGKEPDGALNGIDRLDNDYFVGYTPDNSYSCCISCNKEKGRVTKRIILLAAQELNNK